MNLFRPYRAAEPERDETGRLVGIDRYQEVLGLGWKRFFLSGLLTMAGCLPLTLGVGYAVLSKSALVLLPASLLGGAAAGRSSPACMTPFCAPCGTRPAAGGLTTRRPLPRTGGARWFRGR